MTNDWKINYDFDNNDWDSYLQSLIDKNTIGKHLNKEVTDDNYFDIFFESIETGLIPRNHIHLFFKEIVLCELQTDSGLRTISSRDIIKEFSKLSDVGLFWTSEFYPAFVWEESNVFYFLWSITDHQAGGVIIFDTTKNPMHQHTYYSKNGGWDGITYLKSYQFFLGYSDANWHRHDGKYLRIVDKNWNYYEIRLYGRDFIVSNDMEEEKEENDLSKPVVGEFVTIGKPPQNLASPIHKIELPLYQTSTVFKHDNDTLLIEHQHKADLIEVGFTIDLKKLESLLTSGDLNEFKLSSPL